MYYSSTGWMSTLDMTEMSTWPSCWMVSSIRWCTHTTSYRSIRRRFGGSPPSPYVRWFSSCWWTPRRSTSWLRTVRAIRRESPTHTSTTSSRCSSCSHTSSLCRTWLGRSLRRRTKRRSNSRDFPRSFLTSNVGSDNLTWPDLTWASK